MIGSDSVSVSDAENCVIGPPKIRRAVYGNTVETLADIYQEEANIVVWHRALSSALIDLVDAFVIRNPRFQTNMLVAPQDALSCVGDALGDMHAPDLVEDIAERFVACLI